MLSGTADAEEEAPSEWHVLSGRASISDLEFVSGEASVRLHAGAPATELARFLAEEELFDGDLSVRFWMLPVAGVSSAPLPAFNLLGAEAGFAIEAGEGRVHVFDGDESVATDFSFEILPSGEAAHWMQISIEYESPFADEGAAWRLSIDGEAYDRTLKIAPMPPQAPLVLFFGDESYDVFLDDFEAGELTASAEITDANLDEKRDEDSEFRSSDVARRNNGATAGITSTLDEPTQSAGDETGALASVIFLAPDGDDSHDGTAPVAQGQGVGPKRTLAAAIRTVESGGRIVVSTGIYQRDRLVQARGKSLTILPQGKVIFR